ncbi:hypothetical protein ACYBQN_16305, partial [Klebsiella pneumoniae]
MTRSPQRGRGGRVTGFGEPYNNLRVCLLLVCLNQNIIDKTPVSARIHSGAVRGYHGSEKKHLYDNHLILYEILSFNIVQCFAAHGTIELSKSFCYMISV